MSVRITPVTASNVNIIPASKRSVHNNGQLMHQSGVRVAAYCRVSTGDESQQTSYTKQKETYRRLITGRRGWRFAGIYADEAISGTSRTHRMEFNRMMNDAIAGKFDYIITKSISRFARNTLDTLDCVRQLRQLTPPVGIFFEKENIDTLDAAGELILTILSALAQDESRSISDNIRWSFQKNFQQGKPQLDLRRMLGYDAGENGEWIVNEAQARTVRFIFEQYSKGVSANSIAGKLNEKGWKTVNGRNFSCTTVLHILRNEKYVGDLEMQKTITKSYLTHRSFINKGEAPKYYVKDHHAPIIDRYTWDLVQAMLAGMNKIKGNTVSRLAGNYSPFVNLFCGEHVEGKPCGEPFMRVSYENSARNYKDERSEGFDPQKENEKYYYSHPVWRCRRKFGDDRKEKKAAGGKPTKEQRTDIDKICPSEILHECTLEQGFMEMLYRIKRELEQYGEEAEVVRQFRQAHEASCKTDAADVTQRRIHNIECRIKELEEELRKAEERRMNAVQKAQIEKQYNRLRESLGRQQGMSNESDAQEETEKMTAGSEAEVYAKLAHDIRLRLDELYREKKELKGGCGNSDMLRSFQFFLESLRRLPSENPAGMPLNINGLDVKGSLCRDFSGKAIPGLAGKIRGGDFDVTPQMIADAPDYLPFDRGIYIACIKDGTVRGTVIEYHTYFGVTLRCEGNGRKLNSFIGFRKAHKDGSVDILKEAWQVNGRRIMYKRCSKAERKNPSTQY